METNQPNLPVATWRVFKVVPAALDIMPRYRERVLGVDDVERELASAIESFMPAAVGLRTYDAKRKATKQRHEANLERLRRRTRFWLTYVRLTLPNYEASEVSGRPDAAEVIIDRARGVIEVARSYATDVAPRFAGPLLVELLPLFEQCVSERSNARETAKESQRLKSHVRALALPVYQGVNLLRLLLRNELGASDVDVRALNMDPPARSKPQTPELSAPITAQRMVIGQA